MTIVAKAWAFFFLCLSLVLLVVYLINPSTLFARNITQYKDTISDSAPEFASNHTLAFRLGTTISPGAYIEVTPPTGFEVLGTSTFVAERNVELYVNGALRDSSDTLSASTDLVEIFPGTPGMIRYTLNTSSGIAEGANLELRIGNNTSKALEYSVEVSTTTGTTTTEADIKPIINDTSIGTKEVLVEIYDGGLVAEAGFLIALIDQVSVGPADTREDIPPYRFNGAPSSTVTGVTLNVELFLETDELAVCKYDLVAGTDYNSMPNTFTGTGLIYHTMVVAVTPETQHTYYVRCVDDEGNFNTDDYIITFYVSAVPTGESNTDGNVDGDGTGSGNEGGGDGSGGGGETGSSDGVAPTEGGTSGGGGSGGGGGGGSGGDSGSTAGGGFETSDAPYRSGDARVVISGYAFPGSTVTALVDGKSVTTDRADNSGNYSVTIDAIARGVYTFGVYATDSAGTKSSTFSTSFTVTGARTSTLSNINLSPTVKATPDPVNPGQSLTLSGYALPNSTVTIENEKDKVAASRQSFTATAAGNGSWSINVPTSGFTNGTYKARAKSAQTDGATTNFSNYTLYGVGQQATRPINADLNRDSKVNLTDFSILLFWWNTNGGTSNPSADINSDGKVNLTDFSILLFNWTG
ncbi:hypothetical protein A2929_02045 [Candidatus Kaiserbacteria bacterium RIFCSPLOWO2_01_FULL_45_25]|uniref:Dockerin domain-containing protein n=1 Tax=Candidatus Kaiserbacteria bacterium RIFCSPLOWO2_12_FULL_45_26 TaxID=1798525 RepID=A0A1F6FGM7_9BACT|nr:MAG: hypothetical protein A2Z56_00225 [Candidatus Kaiserbacteria bacterium RIFCSPHIGHO2_12_45_16]OGG71086.1 MAG: hypothetical protein A2929_02045 [Candidatus Kaiserbacteria bacterium RIFCSPLOWO2_01_FULL_45_25]OGG85012.1 MAG: hypothetical protein A3G90_03035 [Candidatus Kaiserbacteria bacterium RIFCSPLOWO2_12_FULL_45_26]